MSRRALAAAVAAAGVSVVLFALVAGFVVAVATSELVTVWWLFGALGGGVALAVVGLTCVNVEPST